MFAAYFSANPLNVGRGANAVTATITEAARGTFVASVSAGSNMVISGLRAGTTMGALVGNVTYTWRIGTGYDIRVVQSGPDNVFVIGPSYEGEVSVQIVSDWETGILTSVGVEVGQ